MRLTAPEQPRTDDTDRQARQQRVVAALSEHLPAHAILSRVEDTVPYECDGLTAYRESPVVVALPEIDAPMCTHQPVFRGHR